MRVVARSRLSRPAPFSLICTLHVSLVLLAVGVANGLPAGTGVRPRSGATGGTKAALRASASAAGARLAKPGFAAGAVMKPGSAAGATLAEPGRAEAAVLKPDGSASGVVGSTSTHVAPAAAASGSAGPGRCPPLSRELLVGRARDNTVMLTVMNGAQWSFGQNWLHWAKKAGITYYVVAAIDAAVSAKLAAAGEPCFDFIDEGIAEKSLAWGNEGWRRMTWQKVFALDKIVDWLFAVVVSDIDVVWLRDPVPALFETAPHADVLFSEDGTQSHNAPGDRHAEVNANPHSNFNTGVYLLRATDGGRAWAHAWRAAYETHKGHDQEVAYQIMRQGPLTEHLQDPRVKSGMDGKVLMAIIPCSIALNGHTYFLQHLYKVKQVDPYVVHATWTYGGTAGKLARLRDAQLWADPPEYYSQASFVTVDLQLPETPADYNSWNENEDMISFHLDSIQRQLQQAYVGLALASAAGRPFILPKFLCFCEKIWYGVVRCRVVDAQNMPLPKTCPTDYLFDYERLLKAFSSEAGGPGIREPSFLDNPATPAPIKSSVLVIKPSATLECSDCVHEEEGTSGIKVVLVPPGLTERQLLPLLEPYKRYRVWRLSFDDVGSLQHAYAGPACKAEAQAYDAKIRDITTTFCCRREEEAPRYQLPIVTQLNMTTQFRYSDAPHAC